MTLVKGERECAGCGVPETETILLHVNIPPLIHRQDLCSKCIKQAIDDSKKKGKLAQ